MRTSRLFETPERPGWIETSLAWTALVLALFTLGLDHYSANGPYAEYAADSGIRLLHGSAVVLDVGIVALVAAWRVLALRSQRVVALLAALALVAALPAWIELAYGASFYYGEVRDKQGLPMSTANWGPIGTTALLAHVLARVRFPFLAPLLRPALLVASIGLQFIAVHLLREPLNFVSS